MVGSIKGIKKLNAKLIKKEKKRDGLKKPEGIYMGEGPEVFGDHILKIPQKDPQTKERRKSKETPIEHTGHEMMCDFNFISSSSFCLPISNTFVSFG